MEYLNEYSQLTSQEHRQLRFKRRYKHDVPTWDDSMIMLRDLVAHYVPDQASVLDLGCGHGNFVLDELPQKWSKKVGIDFGPETTAGNTSCQEIVHGDIHQLPFPEQSFDAVVSLWVFEHVSDPQKVFQEVKRVLKPGGYFAFVTPNKNSLLITLRRLMSKRFADRLLKHLYGREEDDVFDVYYRANTTKQLQQLLKDTGFSTISLKENVDPTYTSFDPVSYSFSKFFSALPTSLAKPHIVGLFKK